MPKIDTKNKVITYDWDDIKDGYTVDSPGTQGSVSVVGNGYTYGQNFDPYRNPGYFTPNVIINEPTNSNLVTGILTDGAVKDASYAYFVSADGKIFKYSYTLNEIINSSPFPHTIAHGAHTGETGDSAIIYTHNSGGTLSKSLFYSFRDGTDWDVGCFKGFAGTPDDDYMSTVPATPLGTTATDLTYGKDYPHPMIIGADDNLYIGSGRYLHSYNGLNGNDGTFEANVLTLPAGFVITCFEKTPTELLIGGFYSASTAFATEGGQAYLYSYNYIDQDITSEFKINDSYLASIGTWNGYIFAVTYGPIVFRGYTKVHLFNGNDFEQIQEIPDTFPRPNGYAINGKQLLLNCGGNIYSIGSPFEFNYVLNSVFYIGTASGIILKTGITSKKYIISGSTYPFLTNVGGFAITTFEGKRTFVPFPYGYKGKIEEIVLYFRTTDVSGGRIIVISIITEAGSQTIYQSSSVATNPIVIKNKDVSGSFLPLFTRIKLNISWAAGDGSSDAPQLQRAEIYYQDIKI